MAIRIIVCSTSDLPQETKQAWGVVTAPMGVTFEGKHYRQDIDMTLEEFYARLATSSTLPTTTQVNPESFSELIAPIVAAGDQALVLCLSSALSGSYQSALIAQENFPLGSVFVVDTRTVTLGEAILTARAVEMRDAGATIVEIVREMEELSRRVVLYAIINDLTYVYKGGRLSAVGMHVGGALKLKPVVSIWEGVANMAGMARGMKGAYRWIADRAAKEGIDERYWVALGDTNAPQLTPDLEAAVFPRGTSLRTMRHAIGMVLGTHAGPGSVAIAYVKRSKENAEPSRG